MKTATIHEIKQELVLTSDIQLKNKLTYLLQEFDLLKYMGSTDHQALQTFKQKLDQLIG